MMTIKKSIEILSIATILFFVSCSTNEHVEQEVLSIESVQNIILEDDISEEINDILDQDEVDDPFSAKGTVSKSGVSSCATRTVVRVNGQKTVTIDFGDSCIGNNGKEYAGKIIIVYTKTATGSSKLVTFDEFSINGNTIEGNKSIERVKENTNGNPASTITIDIQITFKNGKEVSRKGLKVREKIEGKDTRTRGDDVYSISGNWESNRDGFVRTAIITTNLRREYACRFIVSGVVALTRNDASGSIDFGDGTCDNKATFTNANGETKEITLKRR